MRVHTLIRARECVRDCVCMCVHVYACVCVYTNVCDTRLHTNTHTHSHTHTHTHTHTHIHSHTHKAGMKTMYNLAGKKLKGDKVKGAADPAGNFSEKTKNQKNSPLATL